MNSHEIGINLALLLFSLLIGLALTEGLLILSNVQPAPNLLCAYQPDPETGHSLLPGLAGTFSYPPEIDMNFFINSFGMRGPEPDPALKKIVLVGDSMSFGYAVNHEETYASQVNKSLRARGYELLNYATPGFGILRETILVKRALADFDPKILIVGVTMSNDWSDNYTFKNNGPTNTVDADHCLHSTKPASSMDEVKTWIYRNLRTGRVVNQFFRSTSPIETAVNSFARFEAEENETLAEARRITREAFWEIKKLSVEEGFTVTLFLIPSRIGVDENFFQSELANTKDSKKYYRNRERDNYVSICAEYGFTCVDSKPAFEEKIAAGNPSATYFNTRVDHHVNAAGNEVLAGVLIPKILAQLDAPSQEN